MIKVMKFGGTSMGSVESLSNIREIVSKDESKKVIVVSAMSGVTNLLISWMAGEISEVHEVIEKLRKRHTEIGTLISKSLFDEYLSDLDIRLKRLESLMEAYLNDRGNPALTDAISSWGERLSSLMLTYILKTAGIDAVRLTSEKAGIIAKGHFGMGIADLESTSKKLKETLLPLLEKGITPVITGYYGVNSEGKPITFGRGGSDYSAAVIAYGIDADVLEIWTDVDGFMTADPRLVPDARPIEEMNYREAAELAYFGAKVLHARTMEPARLKNIEVRVKNTFNPQSRGTVIHNLSAPGKHLLRSVAIQSDLSIIKVYSSEIVYDPELVCEIITAITDRKLNSYAISTSLSTLAVAIPSSGVKGALSRLNELQNGRIEKVKVRDNVSLICAVGDNLIDTPGVAARIFDAVEHAGGNVEMISEGASDVALNFVVSNFAAPSVVRKLHSMFIGD